MPHALPVCAERLHERERLGARKHQAPGALQAGGFDVPTLESARSRALLEAEIGAPPSALVLAISSETLVPGTIAFETAAASATSGVATAPHVTAIRSHLISPSQVNVEAKIVYDVVLLDLKPDDSPAALEGIQAALRERDRLMRRMAPEPPGAGLGARPTKRDRRQIEHAWNERWSASTDT